MTEDPFDHLDADEDREGDRREPSDGVSAATGNRHGDPFESLDEERHGEADDEAASRETGGDEEQSVPDTGTRGDVDAEGGGSDPFEYMEDRTVASDSGPEAGDRPDREGGDPVDVAGDAFGDVDVSRGDPFEESGSAFQQVDVESVDPDAVWDRFTERAESTEDPAEPDLGGEAIPEDVPDTVEVPKGRFCQTCPHFSPPPDISCTHEGTEIVRFVGTDDVRVRNCPVVAERRELGETYE